MKIMRARGLVALVFLLTFGAFFSGAAAQLPTVSGSVRAATDLYQPVQALVLLDDTAEAAAESTHFPASSVATPTTLAQYQAQMQVREALLNSMKADVLRAVAGSDLQQLTSYSVLPIIHVKLSTPAALQRLMTHPRVRSIDEIRVAQRTLAQSLPLIRQPQAAAAGSTGSGTTVAVLDTGVDYTLPAFGSCTTPGGTCKVAVAMDFPPDDGMRDDAVKHGTNVAATVLGVAPGARIAALDVFTGAGAYDNDILSAINWVVVNKATYNIAAINMSLGSGRHYSPLAPTDSFGVGVQSAVNAGIVVVASSGNDGYLDSMGRPAAYSNIVSVGAVYDSAVGSVAYSGCTDPTTAADRVTCFSDSASFLTMLAPGAMITAAGVTMAGTSQASPHVAGAAAVLRSAYPSDSVDSLKTKLRTGVTVVDQRNGLSKPRLDLVSALGGASSFVLTVTKSGTGAGTVTSNPAGIACGTTCTANFNSGASVTLTAAPTVPGSVFGGWSGACSGTSSTCVVSMTAARGVGATFNPAPAGTLSVITVGPVGSAGGTVTSNPTGISCGGDCAKVFPIGSTVNLTSTPNTNSVHYQWLGACSGTSTACSVVIPASGETVVAAVYVVPTLFVVKAGTGTGTISSTPTGINCGVACTTTNAPFSPGQVVSLTPQPAPGSRFVQWAGHCSGNGACSVTMDTLRVVGAVFESTPTYNLTVLRIGAGTVTSTPAGINCGVNCTAQFGQATSVSLTATPATGWVFANWSGACAGTSPTCTFTINSHTAAIASFKIDSLGSALDNTSMPWSSDVPAWFSQSTTWSTGGSAAQSAVITHLQSTTIGTTVTGPGTLSFKWKVSSESGYDRLWFGFDGWKQVEMSGDSGWITDTWFIPGGNHVLTWTYSKDSSISSLSDAGWLDAVSFVAGTAAAAGSAPAVAQAAGAQRPVRRDFGPVIPK